jgi:hypothetical protein
MVDSLRSDLDSPNLPFISATIGTFMEVIADKYPFYQYLLLPDFFSFLDL